MDTSIQVKVPVEVNGYIILAEIGSGSTGCVHIAREISTGKDFCVKIVPKYLMKSQEDHAFFNRECSTLRSLSHPNVVEFVDLCEDSDNYYLFMEYCKGTTLQSLVANDGPLQDKAIMVVFRQLMVVMCYLQSMNVAHRDIKPDNIIVNGLNQLKLVDFGLCTDNSGNLRQTFCGSPAFAAPECILRQPYDAKASDIWSCGVVLYTITVGQLPWKTSNINHMIKQIINGRYTIPSYINPHLQNLIRSMLNVDPKERPSPQVILTSSFFKMHVPVTKPRIPSKRNLGVNRSSVPIGLNLNRNQSNLFLDKSKTVPISQPSSEKKTGFHRTTMLQRVVSHENFQAKPVTPPLAQRTTSHTPRKAIHI